MGFSEEYINNKRLQVEMEMLEIEKAKTVLLMNISEILMMTNSLMLEQLRAYGDVHDNALTMSAAKTMYKTMKKQAKNLEERWEQIESEE